MYRCGALAAEQVLPDPDYDSRRIIHTNSETQANPVHVPHLYEHEVHIHHPVACRACTCVGGASRVNLTYAVDSQWTSSPLGTRCIGRVVACTPQQQPQQQPHSSHAVMQQNPSQTLGFHSPCNRGCAYRACIPQQGGPPRGCWWMGAQSLVVADEMRHLQSYLGPLDHLIGAVVHLVTVDYYDDGHTHIIFPHNRSAG